MGFYSRAGHSYGIDPAAAAMDLLTEEIISLNIAANGVLNACPQGSYGRVVLSVGATPTATSLQAIALAQEQIGQNHFFKSILHALEIGNLNRKSILYSRGPRRRLPLPRPATTSNTSLDPHRHPPEALMAAGTLALGKKPCKSYPGWGIVSTWGMRPSPTSRGNRSGWQVGRSSQEHGILTPDPDAFGEGEMETPAWLAVGQKLRIRPKHACVAGAMFDLYYVVDSGLEGRSLMFG